jgi:hypothetical protein
VTWRHRAARVLRRAAGVLERWTDRLEATAPAAMSVRPTDDADDASGGERGGPPAHWLARVREAGPGAMLGAEVGRATHAEPVSRPAPVARASRPLLERPPVTAPASPAAPPSPAATTGAMRLGRARPRVETLGAPVREPRADAASSRDAAAPAIGPSSPPATAALEWSSPATPSGPGELAVSTRHAPAAVRDADVSIHEPVAAPRPLRLRRTATPLPDRQASAPTVAPAPMSPPATAPSHDAARRPRLDRAGAANPASMPVPPGRGAAHAEVRQSPRAERSPHWRAGGDAARPVEPQRHRAGSERVDTGSEPRPAHAARGAGAAPGPASPAARSARPRGPGVRYSGGGRLPWPSLPETAVEIDVDMAADALEIEHRARLAREQRGW